MKGHNYSKDEIEVANIIADNGYNVLITPESGGLWVSRVTNKGTLKYADGRINGIKYEQTSLDASVSNPINKVNNVLNHAMEKGAQIAVVYDTYNKITTENLNEGWSRFNSFPRNTSKGIELWYIGANKKLAIYK